MEEITFKHWSLVAIVACVAIGVFGTCEMREKQQKHEVLLERLKGINAGCRCRGD